jgi:hypothetical protein
MDVDGEPKRYFFMHVPKTAGMVLYQRLIHHHGEGAVYPLPFDRGRPGAYMSVDHLRDRFRAHRQQIRVVAGHLPLCVDEVLGIPFTTFTVLRDPVERTLSLLRQHREQDARFREASLDDVYSDPVILHGLVHNFMVKVLSMDRTEAERGVMAMVPYDEDRLERAKQNLEHRVELFGLQERLDDFCGQLASRFGWDLDGLARFTNRTRPSDASDDLRERIARDSAFDVQLFRFARELLERRHGGVRSDVAAARSARGDVLHPR